MKKNHKWGGGLTRFHISYSEIHMYQKVRKNQNKDFIKAIRGGGHHFIKSFHKIPFFLKDGFPKVLYTPKKMVA